MGFDYANRLNMLPPYLFAEIEDKVNKKRHEGVDIIDFGIGDPDLPTPSPIIEFIQKELENPDNHRYPSSAGEAG
ncbi:MAG: aspartate aminotransferase, partial [Methanomassiliicoccales archaeon]|nr:aspartate aminotransferase [Methanomassiliicoccales archaeon]